MNYNIQGIISKISDKTNASEIIWTPYFPETDSNPYSSRYFLTIPELIPNTGVQAAYQNGFLYMFTGFDNRYYLFLQSSVSELPVALNYKNNDFAVNNIIQALYLAVQESFDSLNDFISQIMK